MFFTLVTFAISFLFDVLQLHYMFVGVGFFISFFPSSGLEVYLYMSVTGVTVKSCSKTEGLHPDLLP